MHNWIISNVLGTCSASCQYEEDFNKTFGLPEDDTETFEEAMTDAEVFSCTDCGGYCENSEQSEDVNVCTDCFPEIED